MAHPCTARRVSASAAIATALAVVLPATAAAAGLPAADLPADVAIRVEGNTVRATISVHGTVAPARELGATSCSGPWVHTEASANRILNSPDIDLSVNPEYWSMYQPDSPNTAPTAGQQPTPNRLNLDEGQQGEAIIPAVAEGQYVAGVMCGQYENRDGWILVKYTSLRLYPITVGTPVTPAQGNGSLDGFGSS